MRWIKLLLLTGIVLNLLAVLPASARIADKIIVIVNHEVITYTELEKKLNPIMLRLLNEQTEITPEIKKKALDQLIRSRLIMQEAATRGIEVGDLQIHNRVEGIIADLRANFIDDAEFAEALRDAGLTIDELRDQYWEQAREDLIKNILYAQVLNPEEVVDDDVLHQEYHILHILCATEEDARVAQANIERGVDFSIVATYESIDPHAADGGDWGYVRLGTLPEELDVQLLSLDEGEVSPIIHHSNGYSIIKLVGIRKLEENEISEAEVAALSDHIRLLKIYSQVEAWQQELWDASYVEIKDRF